LLLGALGGAGGPADALRTRSFIIENARRTGGRHDDFGRVRRPKKTGKNWETRGYDESDDEKTISAKKKAGLLDRKAVNAC
jgi:hypothetical protein